MSKVNRTGPSRPGSITRTQDRAVKQRTKSKSPGLQKEDFELSVEARQMDDLLHTLTEVGEINAGRVEMIKAALKNGELPIDYQQLANKILELSDEVSHDKK